ITAHPAKLVEMLVAQALGDQAAGMEPFYQLRKVNAFALGFRRSARSRQSPKSLRTGRLFGATSGPSISSSSATG
ncbi:MAG: hypothetical protein M3N09_06480, partial [Actinomycetota bacterium]|nr:hypothetical protein [Actinomycetota bacterium]